VDPNFPERTVLYLRLQSEINDLVRHLSISKINAELLGFSSKGMQYVTARCLSAIEETPANIVIIFSKDGELVYCDSVEGLLREGGCTHSPEERRIFVD
jgi:hypothetical protein